MKKPVLKEKMIGLDRHNFTEQERLAALAEYERLSAASQKEFEAIARLASYVCKTPIALISFIDEHKQWFKAKIGIEGDEVPRERTLCQYTICQNTLLEIPDIQNHSVYNQVPLGGDSKIRFYAGTPLISPQGLKLGSLCVADYAPRTLTSEQKDALEILSREVISHLEIAMKNRLLEENIKRYQEILALFNNSSELHAVLDNSGQVQMINQSVERMLGYSQAEVVGKNIWNFCSEKDRDEVFRKIEQGVAGGEAFFEHETEVFRKSGEIRHFAWSNARQGDNWVVNARDITAQKKVHEDLQLLSLVASKVNNGVIISDRNNQAIWVNSAFESITGYSASDIIGKQFADILKGPNTDQRQIENARKRFLDKESNEVELLCYRKDGRPVWFNIFSSVILNSTGEVDKGIEIIIDVTKRKEVEEELKILSFAASNTSSGLLIRDSAQEVVWMNEAFEHLSGYSLTELKGKTFGTMLVGEETDREVLSIAQRALENRKPYSIEILLYKKDRTPIWLYLSNNPIFDENGKMERQISIAVDITEKKNAQHELELLSVVASKTANGVVITDKGGCVTWVNSAFETITGYLFADVKNRRTGDLLKGDGTNLTELERARQCSSENKPFNVELLIYRKDGEPAWLSFSNTPVYDARGEVIQQVEIVNDITERKYAEFELLRAKEEALQLSKAKEMFLSVMSHEIRTPLNAILGLSRILQEENPSESQTESLNLLKFSAENLMALINDVLDLTKIETGNLELEAVEVAIRDLVDNTMSSIKFKTPPDRVVVKSEIDNRVPDIILGDETRIYQILMNLLGNAIKFTTEGEICLKLTVLKESENTVELRFEISDTGIGIPEDKLTQIFEAYKQASSDTSRKYGGTGLGLSITKKLIELHNSQIHVASTVGKGTTFSFSIEFKKAAIKEVVNQVAPCERKLSGRILVVDDNKINCYLARKVLMKWDLHIEFAENGQMAVQKVSDDHFDAVLMDIQMPVMNGFDATRAIRRLNNGQFKTLPIIALTASAFPKDMEEMENAGMNGYVLKPFVPADLYSKLNLFLTH